MKSDNNNNNNWGEPHTTEFYAFRGILYIYYLGRAQRSPTWTIHLGFSIYYVYIYIYYYRRTSDRSNFALRRSARRLTAHAHRCVKLKQGRVSDKARCAPSLVFLCVLDGIVLSIEGLQDYWDTTG